MFLNEINKGTNLEFDPTKTSYRKEEMSKFIEPIVIVNNNQLKNFNDMSVCLRTIVVPKPAPNFRFNRDKGFKNPIFEHFSPGYFRDCEIIFCIYKQSSVLVTVVVSGNKVDRDLNDVDFHFPTLLKVVRDRVRPRNIHHISINIVIGSLPKARCEFKILKINGFYKRKNAVKSSRIAVIRYDHSVEVDEYYDNIATSGDTRLMSDPLDFESYRESRTGEFNNINQWLLSIHKESLYERARIIEDALATIEGSKNENK